MRTKHSIINIAAGLGNQVIMTLLSFISRTVFISSLGVEYLGINGLFSNILAILTLVEAGIGSSIVYNLYKPVAENDHKKITMLMKVYRNTYLVIALIILLLGLSTMPFLDVFIKDANVEHIYLIYSVFLLNTVAPYLYVHKNSLLNVNQKNYIVTGVYTVSSILTTLLKIAILHYSQNYILYLLIDSVITILTSIVLAVIVNRMYPFIINKVTTVLDPTTKQNIIKNVKAIGLQNLGVYLVFGTDNLIISSFVSIAAVGLYSNYQMLIEIGRTFINQIFNNIYHSVGNLVAKESKEKVYRIYKVYRLLNFWLYSCMTIFLYMMIEPFITVWIGSDFVMGTGVLLVVMLVFYEQGMRNSITTVKTTSGIFHEDRYAPLCQAAVNLVASIFLVQKIGIQGVFLGTLISALAIPFWRTPYLVFKKVFHRPLYEYFRTYAIFLLIGLGAYGVTQYISNFIEVENMFSLACKAILCLVLPNLLYLIIFYQTEEFQYLLGIFKNTVGSFMVKSKITSKV